MQTNTTRFGAISFDMRDVVDFPAGLMGLEMCRKFVLLADAQNSVVGWLQSISHGDVALAVVSPRRFVPDYAFHVYRSELQTLHLQRMEDAQVLTIVNSHDGATTLNLKAPIVLNVQRRLARQVVANGDHSLQHVIGHATAPLKKSA